MIIPLEDTKFIDFVVDNLALVICREFAVLGRVGWSQVLGGILDHVFDEPLSKEPSCTGLQVDDLKDFARGVGLRWHPPRTLQTDSSKIISHDRLPVTVEWLLLHHHRLISCCIRAQGLFAAAIQSALFVSHSQNLYNYFYIDIH